MQRIGLFNVTSGRIMVSDPCYEGGDKEFPAKNGRWVGLIESKDFGKEFLGGVRVTRLVAYHEDYANAERRDVGDFVGVDSGQMCISDADKFRYLPGEAYDEVCRATNPAGIIDGFTVASSSGWGDGGYMVLLAKDGDKVVGAEVVFIPEGEEEGEEEDLQPCEKCGEEFDYEDLRDGMCEECFAEWHDKHVCTACGGAYEDELPSDRLCEHCRDDS